MRAVLQGSGLFHVALRMGRELPFSAVSAFQSEAVSSLLDDFSFSLTLFFSANGLREDYKFHHTFSNEIAKLLKTSPGKLVVMQPEKFQSKHEPKMHVLDLKVSSWSKARRFLHGLKVFFLCIYKQLASSCWKYSPRYLSNLFVP